MKASKKQAPAEREWDVNATVVGGRHLGRFTAETGADAVAKATNAKAYDAVLCPKCEPKAEDLRVDRDKIVATEVGGAAEVYRTGEPDRRSPAYQLVAHVWKHKLEATGYSWQRINTAMSQALSLAISAGLIFHEDDITDIHAKMRGGYWFGDGGTERFYALAAGSRAPNESACKALEKALGRAAFVYVGTRLHVGSPIQWGEHGAKVTSFAKDGLSLIACTYKDYDERTLDRRLTITLDEIKAAEKARLASAKEAREVEKIQQELPYRDIKLRAEQIRQLDKKQRTEVLAWLKLPRYQRAPAPAWLLALSQESVAA